MENGCKLLRLNSLSMFLLATSDRWARYQFYKRTTLLNRNTDRPDREDLFPRVFSSDWLPKHHPWQDWLPKHQLIWHDWLKFLILATLHLNDMTSTRWPCITMHRRCIEYIIGPHCLLNVSTHRGHADTLRLVGDMSTLTRRHVETRRKHQNVSGMCRHVTTCRRRVLAES